LTASGHRQVDFWKQDGELLVVDPDSLEEIAAAGLMTVVVNTHGDICTIRKTSGIGISMAQVCNLLAPGELVLAGPHFKGST